MVTCNVVGGTLHAKRDGACGPFEYHQAPHDDGIVFLHDSSGRVAVTIIGVDEVGRDDWRAHPDRGEFPADLLDAVDAWFDAD